MSEVIIPEQQEYPITKQDQVRFHTPDLAKLFAAKGQALKAEINCVQVGTVQAFNAATQTVDVTLNVLRIVENVTKQYPVLVNVPVFIPSGGDGRLTMPITAGDQCIVLFCDRSIEAWATAGTVAAPSSERTHDLSDGVEIVGFFPGSKPLSGLNQKGPEMRHGTAKISIENNKIKIKNTAIDYGFQLASMWACRILMTASTLAQQKLMNTLLTALANDSGLNSTSRAAASAAAGGGVIHEGVLTTQGANEVTASDNIGMIIDGSGV